MVRHAITDGGFPSRIIKSGPSPPLGIGPAIEVFAVFARGGVSLEKLVDGLLFPADWAIDGVGIELFQMAAGADLVMRAIRTGNFQHHGESFLFAAGEDRQGVWSFIK